MTGIQTHGVHHVGLTVSRLEDSARFFIELLGFSEIRRDPDYPAIFVSDGTVLLTLWQARNPQTCLGFDKDRQVGLHHLALRVDSTAQLETIHAKLQAAEVHIEFAPEPLRGGPALHMMCYEPSGIRLEFIYPGQA